MQPAVLLCLKTSERDCESSHRHEILQPPATPLGSEAGGDNFVRKWREIVVNLQPKLDNAGERELDPPSDRNQTFDLAGLAEQAEIRERLEGLFGSRSAEHLDTAARRDEGPDAGFTRCEMEQEIVVEGVSLSAKRGFGSTGVQFEIGELIVVSEFAAEQAAGVITEPGADDGSHAETPRCAGAGVREALRRVKRAADTGADLPLLGEGRACGRNRTKQKQ